jgi:uncharacterized protein (TIGR03382 family)
VCEPPAPEPGSDGYFSLETLDGMTVQTVNHTDVSVYGCIDTVQWEVYRGTSQADVKAENLVQTIGAWSPKIAFPEAGDYVVLLNVGGPGGVDAGLLTVSVDEAASDGGCSTTGTHGGLATMALGGLALALRRRRA